MMNNINEKNVGKLYVVGTPIGNLKDITLRAIETLQQVDVILAEDTRQTLKLLNHLNISKHLISYHRHNEDEKIDSVVALLNNGKNLALVSDAGMPIVSDPGENLVKYLIKNGYEVITIPGVTAITTALIKSNLDNRRFAFEGFLSINKKQRKNRLTSLKNETRTIVFYEAPHKLLYTLKDLYEFLGERNICIARELTKIHEEYMYMTLSEAINKIESTGIKGEIVLMVEGVSEEKIEQEKQENFSKKSITQLVDEQINNGIDKKEAMKIVAKQLNISKSDVYKELLKKENSK